MFSKLLPLLTTPAFVVNGKLNFPIICSVAMNINKNIKTIIKIPRTCIPKITVKITLSTKYSGNNAQESRGLGDVYKRQLSIVVIIN